MVQVEHCIYCGTPADSKEHIVATRFIDVLSQDPRGLPVPITLTVNDAAGQLQVPGSTSRGRHTLEYTTRVCRACNNEWMNEMDSAVFDDVAEMIRGNRVELDTPRQEAIAAWLCKVVVTARSEPVNPLPINPDWTDWLFVHHSAIPGWHVWLGRYEGSAPWWYNPHDVSIQLGVGSAAPIGGKPNLALCGH